MIYLSNAPAPCRYCNARQDRSQPRDVGYWRQGRITMTPMNLSAYSRCMQLAMCLALAGCSDSPLNPKKEIAVPEGGPPVLTSEEQAAQKAAPLTMRRLPPSNVVAQASFEQPLEEPRILKPLERWTEQEAAADALGRIGAAAVPAL